MRPSLTARFIRGGIFSLLLFLVPAHASADTDLVLLVDVSTSMRSYFPEVQERLFQEIDQAAVGDRVVIISFGESVRLVARRRVRGPADRAYLRAIAQGLEPRERATYVARGLDRAFLELREFFEKTPDRDRRLLWLSDDKNNPPAALGDNVFTLADLREEHSEFEPEGEWFTFDPGIAGSGNEVAEFLEWARRSLFLVNVREARVDLGAFLGPAMETSTTVTFVPPHSSMGPLEFLVLARVTDTSAPGSPQVDVVVEPSTLVVQEAEWQQEFTLTFDGPPGQYSGYLVFESYARNSFRVDPERIPLGFTLEAPVIIAEAEPEESQTVEEIADEILSGATATREATALSARPLEYNNIEPGYSRTQVIQLSTNAPIRRSDVEVGQVIDLPEGFSLETELTGRDGQLEARITVKVASGTAITEEMRFGGAIEGRVTFLSLAENIEVLPKFRRVRLVLSQNRERWGRREIGGGNEAATRAEAEGQLDFGIYGPSPEARQSRLGTLMVQAQNYVGYVLGGVALLVLVVFFARRVRRGSVSTFFGEMVVIKDPGTRKVRNANLKRLAGLSGKDTLTIGSDGRADIRLQHESVQDSHARIIATPVGDDTVMMLHPARGAQVKVNDQVRTEKVRLNDKDLIAIGDYIFLFSSPQSQRHMVVRFLDGSVLRGTPLEWDITRDSFQLLLEDAAEEDEIAHVEFSDLKAVFFVEEGGEQTSEQIGADRLMKGIELEIEFHDGETLEGTPLSDYTEYAPRFYLVPSNDPTVVSILVERANAKSVVQRDVSEAGGGLFSRS